MKRTIMFISLLAISLAAFASCDKDDQLVDPTKLPTEAQSFIDTNFPSTSIKSVVKEYDDFTYHYDVYLADGTALEFDKHGEWKDVKNNVIGVPDSVVPEKILSYVTTNYSNAFIVDIERGRRYDVELNTDIDLDFSLDGDFIRIDY